jgi:hypothetical protein
MGFCRSAPDIRKKSNGRMIPAPISASVLNQVIK